MKITVESTTKLVTINGIPVRVWEGETASGIRVQALITRVAVRDDQDCSQFERELSECRPPSAEADELWPRKVRL